jgi:tRNA-splicing ligase RtcB
MEQISKRLMNWASILEDATRDQAVTASTMPFIYPHLALMPDAHLGKGATVGSVIPTLGAIIPAAVGVDIGCGMMAIRTGLSAVDLPDDKSTIHAAISNAIPLSAGKNNQSVYSDETTTRIADLEALDGIDQAEAVAPGWRMQLGSLGSGNHFIEISLDEDDGVWLFLALVQLAIINEQAKGALAQRDGITVDQAFVLMRDEPRRSRRKIATVASEMLAQPYL